MPEVNMPRLSDTMEEGTITRWLKHPGDEVKKGEILAEVETDKANMEIEAYDSGILEQILVQEGQRAPIGQAIAIIGTGQDNQQQKQPPVQAVQESGPITENSLQEEVHNKESQETRSITQASSTSTPVAPSHQDGPESTYIQETQDGAKIKASPLARRLAEEHGIDLHQLQGSGPLGRIVRDDIEDYLEQQRAAPPKPVPAAHPAVEQVPTAATDGEVVALTSMQKTIARRLTEAKQSIPHFYVRTEIDMSDALALRQMLNTSAGEQGIKISVNDLIIKACALALEKFPEVNSSLKDGQFIRHKHINIGIAVDIPGGLVVPVIRDANIKGVRSIAREARTLIEKARSNKLTTADLEGGTFSISNLGMMDVTDFVAIINPPEAAILAVASTRKTFVPINDRPVVRELMPVTISADHRILYGATVARFLQEIKRLLQNPYDLLG